MDEKNDEIHKSKAKYYALLFIVKAVNIFLIIVVAYMLLVLYLGSR